MSGAHSGNDENDKSREGTGDGSRAPPPGDGRKRGESKPAPKADVIRLGDVTATDIVCGRGFQIESFSGNRSMHQMVDASREEYLASTKKQKAGIVRRVVQELKHGQGARFLRMLHRPDHVDDGNDNAETARGGTTTTTAAASASASSGPRYDGDAYGFELVNDQAACDKISHAFRCRHRNRAAQQQQSRTQHQLHLPGEAAAAAVTTHGTTDEPPASAAAATAAATTTVAAHRGPSDAVPLAGPSRSETRPPPPPRPFPDHRPHGQGPRTTEQPPAAPPAAAVSDPGGGVDPSSFTGLIRQGALLLQQQLLQTASLLQLQEQTQQPPPLPPPPQQQMHQQQQQQQLYPQDHPPRSLVPFPSPLLLQALAMSFAPPMAMTAAVAGNTVPPPFPPPLVAINNNNDPNEVLAAAALVLSQQQHLLLQAADRQPALAPAILNILAHEQDRLQQEQHRIVLSNLLMATATATTAAAGHHPPVPVPPPPSDAAATAANAAAAQRQRPQPRPGGGSSNNSNSSGAPPPLPR